MKYYIEHIDGFITTLHVNTLREDLIEIHEQDVPLVLDYIKHNPNSDTLKQLADIQQWLKDNDYKVNKHLLGEYADDDERWTTYLQERADKLAQYNALEQQHVEKKPFDLTLLTPLVIEQVEEVLEVSEEVADIVEEVYDPTFEEIEAAAYIPTEEEILELTEQTEEILVDDEETVTTE